MLLLLTRNSRICLSSFSSLAKRFVRTYAIDATKLSPYLAEIARLEKTTPRVQKIRDQKRRTIKTVTEIDETYNVFDEGVKRVLDLGCSPGYWSQYAKDRILAVHHLLDAAFRSEGFIVGVDILNAIPPLGCTTIQGNVISNEVRKRTIEQCKEMAYRQWQVRLQAQQDQVSVYIKEQEQSSVHQTVAVDEQSIKDNIDYKVDVILSDLTLALPQETGFWNSTATKPYMRLATNTGLRLTVKDGLKSPFDLADAILVYAIDLLREGGTVVLRLNGINVDDVEVVLLRQRLTNVFRFVTMFGEADSFPRKEVYFVCKNKNDNVDKVSAFAVKAKL